MTKNSTLKNILLVFSVCVTIAICYFTLYLQQERKPKILLEMRLEVLKTTLQSLRHIATLETTTTMAPFTKKEDKSVTEKNIDKQQARRSLLIFGQDRTGTTFLSAMFAQDPQMFIVYEPLWITKGWRSNEPNYNCSGCELEIVNAILSCKFSRYPSSTKFLSYVKTAWTGALPVNIFTTNHFCNSSGQRKADCSKMRENPNFVDRVCKENFKHSVVKVSPERLPREKLADLVPQVILENPGTEVRVLHLVRDPRGNLNSRINIKWTKDYPHPMLASHARRLCKASLSDLDHVDKLNLTGQYKRVWYKQIADDPVETARDIYNFAGFQIPSDVEKWIIRSTTPSKKQQKQELENPYSPVRRAKGNADKWRNQAFFKRNQVIERECRLLMDKLGLKRLRKPD
ncbi:carbohydrate sulfotransferase 3-like [Acropora millepora]|uniref:carbohydrate sulfotransferase 3-like n=1 Tax=Acropora millepora TaxID=45264 RepID=UPI001CF319A9|nr:carbohydrate sulfotransferase 3-like [Acropora millepora]